MKLEEMMKTARESFTAERVFAAPVDKDGVTVIAGAKVVGGGGGGNGTDPTKGAQGEGGGMGLVARPVGAYVIKDGDVRWVPAVDVNRLIATGAAVVIAMLFTAMRLGRRRRRR